MYREPTPPIPQRRARRTHVFGPCSPPCPQAFHEARENGWGRETKRPGVDFLSRWVGGWRSPSTRRSSEREKEIKRPDRKKKNAEDARTCAGPQDRHHVSKGDDELWRVGGNGGRGPAPLLGLLPVQESGHNGDVSSNPGLRKVATVSDRSARPESSVVSWVPCNTCDPCWLLGSSHQAPHIPAKIAAVALHPWPAVTPYHSTPIKACS
jgi:hypothetical protein